MKITRLAVLLTLSISVLSFSSKAHDGATGIIKHRMEAMKTIGQSMKGLADMMQGKRFYEPVRTHQLAQTIEMYGGSKLTELFPKNSLEEPTQALPVIWSDWKEFEELAAQLSETAKNLVRMTSHERGNNTERYIVKGAFKRLVETCSECHKLFRKKKSK